jgi:hypothetical protein
MSQCTFKTRDGRSCKGAPVGSHGGCYAHDPQFELHRRRVAKKNGRRGGRGRPNPGTADLARLQEQFEALGEKVLKGEVDRAAAAVTVQAWSAARACIATSAKLRELEEIEERLDALEKQRGVT